jgi:hypothetical protein
MTIEEMFPLIMIEFSKLNAKLDKLENPVREVVIEPLKIDSNLSYEEVLKALENGFGNEHRHPEIYYSGNKPVQFPNESYVDYMKRTGQCIEAHCVGKDTCN